MENIQERINEMRKVEQHLRDLHFMFAVDLHDMKWTAILKQTQDMVEKDYTFVKGAFDESIK